MTEASTKAIKPRTIHKRATEYFMIDLQLNNSNVVTRCEDANW
jgi:hypothetical protein